MLVRAEEVGRREVRLAHARDAGEDAELSHPETARPQDVVVELRHRRLTMRSVLQTQGDSRPRSRPVVSLVTPRVMDVILAALAVPG